MIQSFNDAHKDKVSRSSSRKSPVTSTTQDPGCPASGKARTSAGEPPASGAVGQ